MVHARTVDVIISDLSFYFFFQMKTQNSHSHSIKHSLISFSISLPFSFSSFFFPPTHPHTVLGQPFGSTTTTTTTTVSTTTTTTTTTTASPERNFFIDMEVSSTATLFALPGDRITWFWSNNSQHNVVSGVPGQPDGRFRSGKFAEHFVMHYKVIVCEKKYIDRRYFALLRQKVAFVL
jgi:hypothetical protein